MSSRRALKAAAAIREVVSMAILAELRDPRVRHVTVTRVEITADMREAKIYVSVMGDPKQQQLSLYGLENAAGFLQSKVADRIETRYTPKLKFFLDQGVKQSLEIARILSEVLPSEHKAEDSSHDDETPDDDMHFDDASAHPVEPPQTNRPDDPHSA